MPSLWQEAANLWQCPRCRRRFAKKSQWHSCRARTPEDHLRKASPLVRRTWERLTARLRKLGPLRVDAVQTSINFASKYHFGGATVRKDSLRVGFLSETLIEDPRIVHREVLGPRRVGHSVILREPGDVDAQLMKWLERAYIIQKR
ncbi:MAG: hypothetical protein HYR48_08165 [Gemmatimonadetes bacterium]|nr:hypothetical protein [Gemmatimonadota bacterium]